MLQLWIKVRNRTDVDPIEHLDYWLDVFSDQNRYDIHIYNENINLSEKYNKYKIINKDSLIKNTDCLNWYNFIYSSQISDFWKRACFALTVPYLYLNSDYVLNIDGCDMRLYGDVSYYFDKCIEVMEEYNFPTLSYDNILSYNPYDNRGIMLNHWTFGVCISKRLEMMKLILEAINSFEDFKRDKKELFRDNEINIDILMSYYLLYKRMDYKYIAFITENKLTHQGSYYSKFDKATGKVETKLTAASQRHPEGCHIFSDLHLKTIFIPEKQ